METFDDHEINTFSDPQPLSNSRPSDGKIHSVSEQLFFGKNFPDDISPSNGPSTQRVIKHKLWARLVVMLWGDVKISSKVSSGDSTQYKTYQVKTIIEDIEIIFDEKKQLP